MKANKFVKEFGLDKTKKIVEKAYFGSHYRLDTEEIICCHNEQHFYFQGLVKQGVVFIKIEDLKRLVKSHELVDRFGGLEMAKGVVAIDDNESYLGERFGHCDELKQAIADVESCK